MTGVVEPGSNVHNAVESAEQNLSLRPEEAERLFRTSARVNAGLSVEEILDAVFEEFRPILPYDRMEYAHVGKGGRRLTTAWVRTTYEPVILGVGNIVEHESPIREIADPDAPPYLENDVVGYSKRKGVDHPARHLAAEGIRAVLSCPMLVNDEAIGMLFIASRSEAFNDRHIRLIRYVAAQIAGAIAQSLLRRELEERNDELEQMHRERSAFIAAISHELRNPLTSVVGLSATLRDSMSQLDAEELELLVGILARESVEVAGIVDDLLIVAREDVGQLNISPVIVDLCAESASIAEVWRDADRLISIKGDPTQAWADPLRVRQIIRNLVSNAVKYGGEHIRIEVGSSGGFSSVEVVDDGPGVTEQDRDRIFEMYGTSSGSKRQGEAVGLGLAVSRRLAEAMDGTLSYRLENGMSSFLLLLPKPRGQADTAAAN